ncbi:phosphotransferase family protein [Paenibacillus ihumii]|uniref:phosphotransferase family protein n=1 Tax=Paenibacillus ihumii TaxID=687436 RepID=UPI0006D76EE6|nr:phosphotransferase [Paenibacillus ihumii]
MNNMQGINDLLIYVSDSGELNDRYVWRREKLYQGMNGRFVERFYPAPERSYIFKPVTHEGNGDREAWVYEHILSSFPPIYPQLLGRSAPGLGEAGWSIFEDLGAIRHRFDVQHALLASEQIAWWHSYPAEHWGNIPEAGQKPGLQQMASDLRERREEAERALEAAGLPRRLAGDILRRLDQTWLSQWAGEEGKVLSHGDLHLGNYAVTDGGELYILDWEHAHLNAPFWDLYYLIDMSHPRYPKQMNRAYREQILQCYLEQSAYYGKTWEDEEAFIAAYSLFAAVFSLWMLLLVANDLEQGSGVWSQTELLAQRGEVMASLRDCWDRARAGQEQDQDQEQDQEQDQMQVHREHKEHKEYKEHKLEKHIFHNTGKAASQ